MIVIADIAVIFTTRISISNGSNIGGINLGVDVSLVY
jgi:hypothetical protein